jgi:phage recombination protein Bet
MTVTAIEAYQPSAALAIRPGQEMWTDKQRAALTALGIKNASTADLAVFMHYCQKTGLDPFSKQIYMICRREKQGDQWVDKQTIQVGIEGFRVIRDRAAARLGIEVEYEDTIWYDVNGGEHRIWLQAAPPAGCTVTVLKNGRRYPGTLVFSEYVQPRNGTPTGKWRDAPAHQIEKCAEAFALRRAFPHDLGGVYIEDEMPQQEPGGPAVIRQSGRVTLSEVLETEPAADGEATVSEPDGTEPGSVSPQQLGQLQSIYQNRFEFKKAENGHTVRISEQIIGRELTGPRDGHVHANLSAAEATKLLDTLAGITGRDDLIANRGAPGSEGGGEASGQ